MNNNGVATAAKVEGHHGVRKGNVGEQLTLQHAFESAVEVGGKKGRMQFAERRESVRS